MLDDGYNLIPNYACTWSVKLTRAKRVDLSLEIAVITALVFIFSGRYSFFIFHIHLHVIVIKINLSEDVNVYISCERMRKNMPVVVTRFRMHMFKPRTGILHPRF